MTSGVKIGLTILAIGGFCLLTGIIGIAYWFKTNGKQFIEQQAQSAKVQLEAGQRFGQTADNNQCVKQALARLEKVSGTSITDLLGERFFLTGCLNASKPVPGFCTGVPAESEIMAAARWRVAKCQEFQSTHSQCSNILAAMQSYCDKQGAPRPPETPQP